MLKVIEDAAVGEVGVSAFSKQSVDSLHCQYRKIKDTFVYHCIYTSLTSAVIDDDALPFR